ncbi:acyl-CoA dehydrogenase family protein [Actinoplanes sp. CA-252034]|uniref:acyl-CoA dehydrogenase family protein n=1 Tax=Actinoplanes sp. CA-252034 TaxID=3239906 RepID=UPI003D97BA6B
MTVAPTTPDLTSIREPLTRACLGTDHGPRAAWAGRLDAVVDDVIAKAGAEHDGRGVIAGEALDALRGIGAFGVQIPARWGGLGFDDDLACLVVERVARACASTAAILMFHYQVVRRTLTHGDPSYRDDDLTAFADGTAIACSAWTEADSGPDKSRVGTTLTSDGDVLRVQGVKTFCTGLHTASVVHVLADLRRDDGGSGPTFVRIPLDHEGVSVLPPYPLLGLRASGTADLVLDAVPVGPAGLVGPPGGGPALMGVNHEVCLNPGMLALGVTFSALEAATGFLARERPAALGSDLVGGTLLHAVTRLEAAYAYAAHAVSLPPSPRARVASGKVKTLTTAVAEDLTGALLSLVGSRAFRADMPLERHLRDARATSLMGPADSLIQKRLMTSLFPSH